LLFDVQLPQVDGGNAAARDRFNQGMQTALDDLIHQFSDRKDGAQISPGRLFPGPESSRVTVLLNIYWLVWPSICAMSILPIRLGI